ncbi:site-2 protease family protein, partial [candidate division KSB1 bacterium]|nr:site-2 protease family protein [candidate division KSB1 bacterium]
MESIANGILWYIVFIFSTTLHEAAHAFIAYRLGDSTAYEGGQVTLDPLPHIRREPIGTIFFPIISYFLYGWMLGWASAPYNYLWAQRYPKRAALMALSGPLSNLLLVIISILAVRVGYEFGIFYPPEQISFTAITETVENRTFYSLATLISILFTLNLVLFIFNLLPLPPMDGSGVIPLFLKEHNSRAYL